jgi:LPXTG-motif cell wall-anchored protein
MMETRRVAAPMSVGNRGGSIVRYPVRKILGVALFGVLAVFVSAPALAGAQTVPGEGAPPSPGDCVINSITPNPFPPGGSVLTVAGTAPAGVELQIYYNEVIGADGKPLNAGATPVASVVVPANGNFSVQTPFVSTTTDVSANYTFGNQNFYATGCSNVAGQVVVRVTPATVAAQTVTRLAFTGSSNTPTYVLIGLGAVIVGVVLVVASRRRARMHS